MTMTDITLVGDKVWAKAKRRADVIRPIAALPRSPLSLVREAAEMLAVSERHIFKLIKRYRECNETMDALLPGVGRGGKGRHRLDNALESTIQSVINEVYLTPQRRSVESAIREIRRRCHAAGLKPPSGNTIRRRIRELPPEDRGQRTGHASRGTVVSGATPTARHPLDVVQMDHTKVDIILVDPIERKPIGRPWLSVAIDIYSRCIVGMHVSLEAPSATSVGLCMVHMASDKASWLSDRGIEGDWPIQGKPRRVSVDNGAEFHSAAFERGCDQHGIEIHWRPPGQPHYGGIVERVIGSLMTLVHELPGTTFSNPEQRGRYDSNRTACLTLEELEHWLAVAITGVYHQRPHQGLAGESPLHRLRTGLGAMKSSGVSLPVIRNPRAYLVDFLPILRRTVQRNGITIDRVTYFSSALKPWITSRNPVSPILVRRDPRDISRIYLFDPTTSGYLEIPYRDLSRPTISLWEHRLALTRLREQNRELIDERALFRAIEELRDIERTAVRSTRTARRNQVRRKHAQAEVGVPPPPPPIPEPQQSESRVFSRFPEIEAW